MYLLKSVACGSWLGSAALMIAFMAMSDSFLSTRSLDTWARTSLRTREVCSVRIRPALCRLVSGPICRAAIPMVLAKEGSASARAGELAGLLHLSRGEGKIFVAFA